MGVRACQDLSEEHVGEPEVPGVEGLARDLYAAVYLGNASADDRIIFLFHLMLLIRQSMGLASPPPRAKPVEPPPLASRARYRRM